MAEAPTTRRAILRSGLLAAGAVAGMLGLTRLVQRPAPVGQITLPAGGTQLKVYGHGWSLSAPGLRRGDLPQRGQQVSVTGRLTEAPEGAEIGTFFGTVTHLDTALDHGPYASMQMETHTFQFSDGTLVGMGTVPSSGEGVFAIVGGTGTYLGATGSYVATQSPVEVGGDGTAEFTLTFTSGR
jgi:hypothetical protein